MASLKDSIIPEFKNMKFRVKDEEHSKKIQEHLFSLGYKWSNTQFSTTIYKSGIWLFTNSYGRLSFLLNDKEYFDQSTDPEYQLKEIISYELEEVKPVKKIVATLGIDLDIEVTINGEKISLKELKELLNKD